MRELTAMQAACWFGRNAHAQLGGVSAHLYAEFDGHSVDVERLQQALASVLQRHPMLGLWIDGQGRQGITEHPVGSLLEVEDLRVLAPLSREQRLLAKRRDWSHQQLDLAGGQAARFSLTLLPEDQCRLHVDTDMVAIDPSSFRILIEDLAALYLAPECALAALPSYFEWLDKNRTDPAQRTSREQGRTWWRERLASVAAAPCLPFIEPSTLPAQSQRLSHCLTAQQRQALQVLARQQRVTLSNLCLGVFALTLAEQCGQRKFRLNVPSFWRAPVVDGVAHIVGEFANVLIVSVDLDAAATPAMLCQQLAGQMIDLLANSSYSGVNVMRDLSRYHGTPQLAPVVFTAALDLPGGELFSGNVGEAFGAMNWVISQGPQVALDAQIALSDGGILLNWDTRLDALPEPWLREFFQRFSTRLEALANGSDYLSQPLDGADLSPLEQPLNALQQAYLLGRRDDRVLGGVAMQEFREYRGTLAPGLLRSRLHSMLRRHPSLRTVIDAQRLVQHVSAEGRINLDEVDFSQMPLEDALRAIEQRREDYAHALFDLNQSPWNITSFHLIDGSMVVFARFDALIIDGRGIAALLLELIDGISEPAQATPATAAGVDFSAQRKAAAAYWRGKLQGYSGAPRLPWCQPLEQITVARYARHSQVVPQAQFNTLCKLAARQRLFKNSALMALVLEVLSHWLADGELFVAVPVAPPTSQALANHSSFIALNWSREQTGFVERATGLQADVMQGLEHLAYSGVDLARLLYDAQSNGPVFPVVITNGFSWPVAPPASPMQLSCGLTQTPQVAMDIRFSSNAAGDLQLDIDYAREAIEAAIVRDIMQAIVKAVELIAHNATLELTAPQLISTPHYGLNTPPSAASRFEFLGRIAANIFDPGNHAVALVSAQQSLTYAQLGVAVGQVIAGLQTLGLKPGSVLALCLPRSTQHSILTLACALSGIIWVPIDAASPQERLRYLLDNCQPDLVVTQANMPLEQRQVTAQYLLDGSHPAVTLQDLNHLSLSDAPAYYLYTSGTTGKPKCVVLSNRATANVIGSTLQQWQVSSQDVFISVTPLHHDMSVFDVFGSLAAGAKLVLPSSTEEKDARRWNQLIAEHQVTLWCSVPAILEMLLACRGEHDLRSVRLFAQGGDYIKPAIISALRVLKPEARLISLGGPTETTIWSIWHEIAPDSCGAVPYGQPLPGNAYYLLNAQGEHCPSGVVGRIYSAGVNLALGYLQDGQLAQSDFVSLTDEHGQTVRAFRSGDCGRYRHDGTLIFDSRVNGYVKIRGVRVSLPDVEIALIEHPALKHVLVVDYAEPSSGDAVIGVLYVAEAADTLISHAELREYARAQLPQSHVPTRFLSVPSLPLSANGKPDRGRARSLLSAPAHSEQPLTVSVKPMDASISGQVLEIYLSVLGHKQQPLPGQDFLSLGLRPQHLKAIAARLQQVFAIALTPAQLLRCRTADDVGQLLRTAS